MGSIMREEDGLRIAERAAYWHMALNRGGARRAGEVELAQFMSWLEESPLHVREFLLQQAWEIQTNGIDGQRRIDVDALLARGAGNILPLPQSAPVAGPHLPVRDAVPAIPGRHSPHAHSSAHAARRQPGRWRWAAAAVATIGTLAVISWQLLSGQTYSTTFGELRTVELTDGSTIQLSTRSTVKVAFSGEAREISLLAGEALFDVAPDATRPFRVHAGQHVIQAVGTQFTVNRRPLGTVVSVVQGAVRVLPEASAAGSGADTLLSAGEEVIVEPDGRLQRREPVQNIEMVAWRERRLVFRDDALADIAAEFNRYNRGTQIMVEGETARNKRYGGIFDADDPEAIVRFVAQDPALTIRREGERIVIR